MFFRKKIQRSDEEITIKEVFRYRDKDFEEPVEIIYFDILLCEPRRKIGYCDLRMGMNSSLVILGQVGYHIDERFRGHHYALKACRLLFECAKELGMESLLITCNPENIPSRKTLEALGGTMEKIVPVPCDHECFLRGDRRKCVFVYDLNCKNQ